MIEMNLRFINDCDSHMIDQIYMCPDETFRYGQVRFLTRIQILFRVMGSHAPLVICWSIATTYTKNLSWGPPIATFQNHPIKSCATVIKNTSHRPQRFLHNKLNYQNSKLGSLCAGPTFFSADISRNIKTILERKRNKVNNT